MHYNVEIELIQKYFWNRKRNHRSPGLNKDQESESVCRNAYSSEKLGREGLGETVLETEQPCLISTDRVPLVVKLFRQVVIFLIAM